MNLKVVFSNRAYTAVLAETLSKINTETGGAFLGKHIGDVWYIVESIDPGPKSIFKVDYFEYDQPYVQHLINKKALLYQSKLELIGLWHRHPGSFDIFSKTDGGTNSQYAAMRPEGTISMLVNLEPEFRFTIYHVGIPCTYTKLKSYEVGDELFPQELLKYKDPEILKMRLNGKNIQVSEGIQTTQGVAQKSLDDVIKIILPELLDNYSYSLKAPLNKILCKKDYSEKIADEIASDILFISDRYGIEFYPTPLTNKMIVAQGSGKEKIELTFWYNKKESTILVEYEGNVFYYKEGLFESLIRKELQNGI